MRQIIMEHIDIHPVSRRVVSGGMDAKRRSKPGSVELQETDPPLGWLAMLRRNSVHCQAINVRGVEPFLHRDLAGYLCALRLKHPRTTLALFTDGFWLSEEDLHANLVAFTLVDALHLTRLPANSSKEGARKRELLLALAGLHHHLRILTPGPHGFAPLDGLELPARDAQSRPAAVLLPDGRLLPPDGSREHPPFPLAKGLDGLADWLRRVQPADALPADCGPEPATPWTALRHRRELEYAYHLAAARRLMASGLADMAERKLLRLLRNAPERPETHNALGEALRLQKEPAAAERCFRRALALKPGHPEARRNLTRLRSARAWA